jgi:hypothetical protein
VARGRMAPHKKTPDGTTPASCFWMKAASCCNPSVGVPGHPAARHPSSTAGTATTASRPHRRSRLRPCDAGWAFTSAFIPTTSARPTWWRFCSGSTAICRDGSSLSWTAGTFTARRSASFKNAARIGLSRSGCRPTPRTSNPVEQVRSHARYSDLATFIPDDLADLDRAVRPAMAGRRDQPTPIRSYFHLAGLRL